MIPSYDNITSTEAIASTIDNDRQVRHWFSSLLLCPAIKSRLIRDERTKQLFKEFTGICRQQKTIFILIILFLLLTYVYLQKLILLGIIPCLCLGARNHFREKKLVQELSLTLLSSDFEGDVIRKKTLYQIGEFYADKYRIPSIIQVINTYSRTAQNFMITVVILLALIIPAPVLTGRKIILILATAPLIYSLLISFVIAKIFSASCPDKSQATCPEGKRAHQRTVSGTDL